MGFFDKYCDEAYAVIDEVNSFKKKQALDSGKLKEFLDSLKKEPKIAIRLLRSGVDG